MDERVEIEGNNNTINISGAKNVEIEGKGNIIKSKGDSVKVKDHIKNAKTFFSQKKVQNALIIIALILVIVLGSYIRFQNMPLLTDSTTGEYIPLALDPFYFLRAAETIIDNGSLPAVDSMRYPSLEIGFDQEILPKAIVFFYKFAKVFNGDISLRYVDVISPVIFYILGLIVFFLLIYLLTKNRITALVSSIFLAFVPSYLYRTMAGFADHEAIGMFAFFSMMIITLLAIKKMNKEKISMNKSILWGLAVAFLTTFTITAWGGIANFCFVILPLSLLIIWLLKFRKNEKNKLMEKHIVFYSTWLIFSVLFGFILGFSRSLIFKKFILGTSGLLSLFVLGFIIVDYFLVKNIDKIKKIKKKYRQAYSIIGAALLGIIFLIVTKQNVLGLVKSIWDRLLHPFGLGRVGLTIAENAQPYLTDIISQSGKILFWMFVLGSSYIGIEISKNLKEKKERNIFSLLWILMISGILFSRISETSLLNGTNFISQIFYLAGLVLFGFYAAKLYFKNRFNKIKPELIVMASWMFFMIVSGRSAIRFLFALSSFICFAGGYFLVKTYNYIKKSKDEIIRVVLIVLLIAGIILAFSTVTTSYRASKYQASVTGPSANYQWQGAMSWVRENTPEGSKFVHWWDYGYWVQYLGERPTITDGGHANGFWDHLIGRYVLTTPYPETALSFMKAHDVSYLLIDPTDLGKYAAYSKIGGDDENDRFAYLQTFLVDKSQTRETSTGKIRIYQGGLGVDEDILYNQEGSQVFLPGPTYDIVGNPSYQSYVGGVVLESGESEGNIYSKQPEGVYFYNNQQIRLPLRYVYFDGELIDFGSGVEAVFFILPQAYEGGEIDLLGAGIYLSPKVSQSLFAQLYLMNDPEDKYSSVELAHTEQDIVISSLKMQGMDVGDFIYYGGFRGPIKIWKINDNSKIIAREEFLRTSGDYAEFDELEFVV